MAAARRGRASARLAAADAMFERRLKSLVRSLRNQPGVPVRQPAHAAAPFRAVPINAWGIFQGNRNATGWSHFQCPVIWEPTRVPKSTGAVGTIDAGYGPANGTTADVDVTGGYSTYDVDLERALPPFPDGYIGFITHAGCWAYLFTQNSPNIAGGGWQSRVRWSWAIDRAWVPGYRGALCTVNAEMPSAVAGAVVPAAGQIGEQLGCHVMVRSGQRSYVEGSIHYESKLGEEDNQVLFLFRLTGYMIPTRTDDATILGTMTD
jgi:hypothetical protein